MPKAVRTILVGFPNIFFIYVLCTLNFFSAAKINGQQPFPEPNEEVIFVDTPRAVVDTAAGARLVQASQFVNVEQARNENGVDGSGFVAAVIDTGIMLGHRDFGTRLLEGANFSADGQPQSATNDARGHGTHVAGIIAAEGVNVGMAPAASVVPIKVFSDVPGTGASNIAIINGLKWIDENAARLRITVVNLSLGSGNFSTFPNPANDFENLIAKLSEKRIAVVCATGNDYGLFREQGMAFPAVCRNAISVGAIYDANVGRMSYRNAIAYTTAPGRIAPFSQRLHLNFGVHPGTTILAPGAVITSSGLAPPNFTSNLEGTSMATPLVSGVVLLMQQAYFRTHQELPTREQLVKALQASARIHKDGDDEDDNVPNTEENFAILDAAAALKEILSK